MALISRLAFRQGAAASLLDGRSTLRHSQPPASVSARALGRLVEATNSCSILALAPSLMKGSAAARSRVDGSILATDTEAGGRAGADVAAAGAAVSGRKEKSPVSEEEIQGTCLPPVARATSAVTRLNTLSMSVSGCRRLCKR